MNYQDEIQAAGSREAYHVHGELKRALAAVKRAKKHADRHLMTEIASDIDDAERTLKQIICDIDETAAELDEMEV